MKDEKQKAIDKITDAVLIYQAKNKGNKPVRIYMSTALYRLISGQRWKQEIKAKMFGVEIKCFVSKEFEFSICEVVKTYELFR